MILGGELVGESAAVVGAGRVSGIKMKSRMLLLAADYYNKSGGEIQLKMNLPAKSTIFDAFSGESVQTGLSAGQHIISIPLEGSARVCWKCGLCNSLNFQPSERTIFRHAFEARGAHLFLPHFSVSLELI